MKTIVAYKQGGNWVVNINGYLKQLHPSIKTKKDVQNWFKECQDSHDYEDYELVFGE